MKKLLIITLGILIPFASQAAPGWHDLKVGTFTSLEVVNDLDVTCRAVPDSVGCVRFFCEDELASSIMFENKGTNLKVMTSPDFMDAPEKLPAVIVYTDALEKVQSSSERHVHIEMPAKCPKFKAVLIGNGTIDVTDLSTTRLIGVIATGNGNLNIAGTADDTLFKLTGTGKIVAHNLSCNKVTCHVFGGGEIFCHPTEELVLKGLGSTRVYYKGKPAKIKKTGLGKLISMDDQ